MHLTTEAERSGLPVSGSAAWLSVAIVASLAVIFLLDHRTGAAPVQHLYYVPIILAAARFRMRGGLVAASVAVLLYHVANPELLSRHYREPDVVQMVLFFAIAAATAGFARDHRRLHQLAMTDDLTGLHNLRSFEAILARMVKVARTDGSPIGFLAVDLDRLKSLNDRYGHLTGAEAVRTVGHSIGRHLPPVAVACRYGGDEFAIAIPDCDLTRANRIADELREAVRLTAPTLAGRAFPAATLTISVGATSSSAAPDAWLDLGKDGPGAAQWLFNRADRALYKAKEGGRDRVGVA